MVGRPDLNPAFVRDASRVELDRLREKRVTLSKELRKVSEEIAWRESLLAISDEIEDGP